MSSLIDLTIKARHHQHLILESSRKWKSQMKVEFLLCRWSAGSLTRMLLCARCLVVSSDAGLLRCSQDGVGSSAQLAAGGGGAAENGLLAPPQQLYHGERARAMSASGKVRLFSKLVTQVPPVPSSSSSSSSSSLSSASPARPGTSWRSRWAR